MKRMIPILMLFCILLSLGCGREEPEIKGPPRSTLGDDGIATVLIDPGHGFGDVGCGSEYLGDIYEFQLTMDFSKRLEALLSGMGYTVILTHDGESYPTEDELCFRATEADVDFDATKMSFDNGVFDAYERAVYSSVLDAEGEIDLMLSIHVNANAESDIPTGFEVDYCAENSSSEMTVFAFDAICDSLAEHYPERRLKRFADSWDMSFIVTKYNSMPSVLIETGFASTASDAILLLDDSWREGLMEAVAKGVAEYFSFG